MLLVIEACFVEVRFCANSVTLTGKCQDPTGVNEYLPMLSSAGLQIFYALLSSEVAFHNASCLEVQLQLLYSFQPI